MVAEVFPANFWSSFNEELNCTLTFTLWKLRERMMTFLESNLKEALGMLAGQEEVTNVDNFLAFFARQLIADGNSTIYIPSYWLSAPLRDVELSESVDELFIVPNKAPEFSFLHKFDRNFADRLIQYLYLFSCRLVLQLLRLVLSFEKVSEEESSKRSILKMYKAVYSCPVELLASGVVINVNNNTCSPNKAPIVKKAPVSLKNEAADIVESEVSIFQKRKTQQSWTMNLTRRNESEDLHFLPSDQHSYGLLARDNEIENIWHLIKDFQEPKDMIYAVFDDSLGNFVIQNERLNDYFGRNLWKLKEKMQFYMAHHLKSSAERLLKMEETLALEDLENFRIEVMNFLGNSEGEATILCKWGKLPVYLEKDKKIEEFMRSDENLYSMKDLMTHHGILRKEPIIFEKEILEALFMFTQRVILQLLRTALNIQFSADGSPTIIYNGNVEIEQPILGDFELFLKRDDIKYKMILREDDDPNIWHLVRDFKSPDEMLRAVFHHNVYDEIVADINLHFKLFQALWTLKNRMNEFQGNRLTTLLFTIFGRNERNINEQFLPKVYKEIADFLVGGDPESVCMMPYWFKSEKNLIGIPVDKTVLRIARRKEIHSAFESLKVPEELHEKIISSLYWFAQRITLQFLRFTLSIRRSRCLNPKVTAVHYVESIEPAPKVKKDEERKRKRVDDESDQSPSKFRCFSIVKALESCKRQAHEKNLPNATPMETDVQEKRSQIEEATLVQKNDASEEERRKSLEPERSPVIDPSLQPCTRADIIELRNYIKMMEQRRNETDRREREQMLRILNLLLPKMETLDKSLHKTLSDEMAVHQGRCEVMVGCKDKYLAEMDEARAQVKERDEIIHQMTTDLLTFQRTLQEAVEELKEAKKDFEKSKKKKEKKAKRQEGNPETQHQEEVADVKPDRNLIPLNGNAF
ncbi:unnamed protein product [Caenorhabditis auriculariae]|uniref:Uncharacterized protein n=1 Tax=Caenorhabditis auriculariae TaxID=2777116 RepID=A0A8S1HG17_9PELO|nr:unnamed protein product [Caenorhabditis auriculariae]